MRVIPPKNPFNDEAVEKNKQSNEPDKKSETKIEDLFVKLLGKESYTLNLLGTMWEHYKVDGLFGIAKFIKKLYCETKCNCKLIKKYLITKNYKFAYPAVQAIKSDVNFEDAKANEEEIIGLIAKGIEDTDCFYTKSVLTELGNKHIKNMHLIDMAIEVSSNSKDNLLISYILGEICTNAKN